MESMWRILASRNLTMVSDDAPFKCDKCQMLMINAHISNCGCQFCKACLDKLVLSTGARNCPGSQEECKQQTLTINEDIFIDNSSNIKISKLKAVCANSECKLTMELGKMDEHLRVCTMSVDDCPYLEIGCVRKTEDKESLSNHLGYENIFHARLLMDTIADLRNELKIVSEESEQRKQDIVKIQMDFEERLLQESEKNRNIVEQLREYVDGNRENLCSDSYIQGSCASQENVNGLELKGLSIDNGRLPIGEMTWLVENFYQKTQNARNKKKLSIHSDRFLSCVGGYTMGLTLYPYGCTSGKGRYLYIGFNIMKGDFDDQLPWPFRGAVTVSIVDQVSLENKFIRRYTYDSVPENLKYLLDRPKTWRNHGFGDIHLIELAELHNCPTLLMNDSLLLRCSVESFEER